MKRLVCLVAIASVLLGSLESSAVAGTVEGTVTPIEWAQEVEVCVLGVVLSEWCAVPKANGSYVYPGVFGTVTLEFIPPYRSGLLTQYYDHKPALAEAEYIGVGLDDVEGIDADLLEGGSITGVVAAEAGGSPLPEVEVCAVPVPPLTSNSCEETNASGKYSLHSLPSGQYNVGFWGRGRSAEYEPTHHEQESRVTPIEVVAGRATPGIDAVLVKGGQISGRVFAAGGGVPLDDIAVCLFSGTEATSRRCTDSDETGAYSFQGLPSGSYQVGFSLEDSENGGSGGTAADDLESQYYVGVAARAQAATIPLLAPGTVEGIDARLSRVSALPPSARAPIAVGPPDASIAVVPEPEPKATRCKKPRHKAKVDGEIRCVSRSKHRKPAKPPRQKKSERR